MSRTLDLRPSSRVRALFVALVALAAGGMLAAGLSVPAFAVVDPTLTVKVTTQSGAALTNVDVYAITVNDGSEPISDPDALLPADPVPGKPGYFEFGLADSSITYGTPHTLAFFPTGSAQLAGSIVFLGGGSTFSRAQTFTPSVTNNFISAAFNTGASVTGKVTSPSGSALKSAKVYSYLLDDGNWESLSSTTTNSKGVYSLTDLEPGSYKFEFRDANGTYPDTFSGGQTSLDAATPTYINLGTKATVNGKLLTGTGSITGTAYIYYGDEGPYYHVKAVPVAYPVTDSSGSEPTAIDTDAWIGGAPSSSKGNWSISHLPPGEYVVQLEPWYYNEPNDFLTGGAPSHSLSDAEIFTVTAGHTIKTGLSEFVAGGADSNYSGGAADIRLSVPGGGTVPAGVIVTLTDTTSPDYYFQDSTSSAATNPIVELGNNDNGSGQPDMVPGTYKLTVIDPSGTLEPNVQTVSIDPGFSTVYAGLTPVTIHPGFSVAPSIAETDTTVGTTYDVSEVSARGDATLSYQWLRNNKPIYGAIGDSYASTGSDADTQLSVRVTASSFGFDDVSAYASVGGATPTPETAADAPTNSTAPSFSPATDADVHVGTVLQAASGSWDVNGLGYHYQWTRNGDDIGTHSARYTVTDGDIGGLIGLTVTTDKPGYATGTAIASTTVTPSLRSAPVLTKAPVVSSKVSHGVTTYSVTAGSWSVSGTTPSYNWSVDGSTLPSGTSSKYVLGTPPDDALYITVAATKDGYTTASVPILARKGAKPFVASDPAVVTNVTEDADITAPDQHTYVGEHLEVSAHGVWSYLGATPDSFSYQWLRQTGSGTPKAISKATGTSYTLTSSDLGATIWLAETPQSFDRAATATQTTAEGIVEQGYALAADVPSIAITGAAASGYKLSGKVGAWETSGVHNSYRWYDCPVATCDDATDASGFVAISGQTKSTLTVKTSYRAVLLRATGSKAGYTSAAAQSSIITVADSTDIPVITAPTIKGSTGGLAHVAQKLTVTAGKYAASSVHRSYQWQVQHCIAACGTTWTDATTTTSYTPAGGDYDIGNTWVRVVETVTKSGHTTTETNSDPLLIGQGTLTVTHAPTVSVVGSNFSVNLATNPIAGGTPTYQWSVDGNELAEYDSTFPTAGTAGSAVYVDITYRPIGYAPMTTRATAQKGAAPATDPSDHIVGAAYGDTLGLANQPFGYPDTAPGTTTLTYKWYSGSSAIKGQTHATFTPSSSYVHKSIKVKVTGKNPYYADGSYTSPAIVLASGSFGTPESPTLSETGGTYPGNVITVTRGDGYSTTSGVTFKTQWQRNTGSSWSTISGATKSAYTPVLSDIGDQLRASITASKSGYATTAALYSNPVTVGYAPTLVALSPPSISAATVGESLSVDPGDWNTPGLTYSYLWFRNGVPVEGATSASFTPPATSAGDELSVQVTASHSGYQPEEALSNTVTVAEADAPTPTSTPTITLAGGIYTVSTPGWSVPGLTYTYQWKVDGVDATGTGAHTDSYEPLNSDSGVLSVVITATRQGYADGTAPITGPTLVPTP